MPENIIPVDGCSQLSVGVTKITLQSSKAIFVLESTR
jgi:hypothetical protein